MPDAKSSIDSCAVCTTGFFSGRPVNVVGPAYPTVSRLNLKSERVRRWSQVVRDWRQTLTWNQESN
jgi:hypothetical protein